MNPSSVQDLVNAGFHGYQGWGNAEALADYKSTGGQGKGQMTGSFGGGGGANLSSGPQTYNGVAFPAGGPQASVNTLQQGINATNTNYKSLLDSLRKRSDTSTAAEFGKRGIPTSSGIVGNAQNENFANISAGIGVDQQNALNSLFGQIAGYQSQGVNPQSTSGGAGGAGGPSVGLDELYNSINGGDQTGGQSSGQDGIPNMDSYLSRLQGLQAHEVYNNPISKELYEMGYRAYNPTVQKLGIPYDPNQWKIVPKEGFQPDPYTPQNNQPVTSWGNNTQSQQSQSPLLNMLTPSNISAGINFGVTNPLLSSNPVLGPLLQSLGIANSFRRFLP